MFLTKSWRSSLSAAKKTNNNSWSAQVMFQRRLKSGFLIDIGVHILSVDFDDTLASGNLFTLDARMTGLIFGFTWD
jgi:hypothetical protein